MCSIKRGALIVIEGVDRSGKSTQCKKLVESLENSNIKAKLLNFPDRTTSTGKLISEYLKNKECKLNDQTIHLLFSANRWETVDRMKDLLYSGVSLVVDRYSYSGIAFSAAKKNMDLNWCMQPENGLPKPDLVFLLTLNSEETVKRPGFGDERYENIPFQQKVADTFNKLYDEEDNWVKIDASGSIDSVQSELCKVAFKTVEDVGMSPLQILNFSKYANDNSRIVNGNSKMANGTSKIVNGNSKITNGSPRIANGHSDTANGHTKIANGSNLS